MRSATEWRGRTASWDVFGVALLPVSISAPQMSHSSVVAQEFPRSSEAGQAENAFPSGRLRIPFEELVLEVQTRPDGGCLRTPGTFVVDGHRATSGSLDTSHGSSDP